MAKARAFILIATAVLGGCATGAMQSGQSTVRTLEGTLISTSTDGGVWRFSATTPQELFAQALAQMKTGRCDVATAGFDRLVASFPESRFVAPALYNAGLCLQRTEAWAPSVARYETLLRLRPDSRDVKHAHFQLAFLYAELEQWDRSLTETAALRARHDLIADERVEADARHAWALLHVHKTEEAASTAQDTLRYVRTRRGDDQVRDNFFSAMANYVLAETLRARSEAIEVPPGVVAVQRQALEQRAQWLLKAQRTYFDTMGWHDAYWSAAAGFRIGALYDGMWHAITNAPAPPSEHAKTPAELAEHARRYKERLQELARPLIGHAIRYWELTLLMVERTGVRTEWNVQIRHGLDMARQRLREQLSRS